MKVRAVPYVIYRSVSLLSLSHPLLKAKMPHEGQRTPEQALTSKSEKGKEVEPLERGLDFLTICGSSSSKVCGVSFRCCYFSLSLPLLKLQP